MTCLSVMEASPMFDYSHLSILVLIRFDLDFWMSCSQFFLVFIMKLDFKISQQSYYNVSFYIYNQNIKKDMSKNKNKQLNKRKT